MANQRGQTTQNQNGNRVVEGQLGGKGRRTNRGQAPSQPQTQSQSQDYDYYGDEPDDYYGDEPIAPVQRQSQRQVQVQPQLPPPTNNSDDVLADLLDETLAKSDEIDAKVTNVAQVISQFDTRLKAIELSVTRMVQSQAVLADISDAVNEVADAVLDADSALGTFVNVAHLREDARDLRALVTLQEEIIGELVTAIGSVPTSVLTSERWNEMQALKTSIHERGIIFGGSRYAEVNDVVGDDRHGE